MTSGINSSSSSANAYPNTSLPPEKTSMSWNEFSQFATATVTTCNQLANSSIAQGANQSSSRSLSSYSIQTLPSFCSPLLLGSQQKNTSPIQSQPRSTLPSEPRGCDEDPFYYDCEGDVISSSDAAEASSSRATAALTPDRGSNSSFSASQTVGNKRSHSRIETESDSSVSKKSKEANEVKETLQKKGTELRYKKEKNRRKACNGLLDEIAGTSLSTSTRKEKLLGILNRQNSLTKEVTELQKLNQDLKKTNEMLEEELRKIMIDNVLLLTRLSGCQKTS